MTPDEKAAARWWSENGAGIVSRRHLRSALDRIDELEAAIARADDILDDGMAPATALIPQARRVLGETKP